MLRRAFTGYDAARPRDASHLGHPTPRRSRHEQAPRLICVPVRPLPARLVAGGWDEPTYSPVWPDAIEAVIASGALEQAHTYLEQYEARAERSRNPWALSTAARCRGLLQAAAGDVAGAIASFEVALSEDAGGGRSNARVRSSPSVGHSDGRSRNARRARAGLGRIGGRAPNAGELTPTERRVAALVAAGRSNKEIASELFVTVRTVETHLTKVYAKLGVHSRTELVSRLFT